MKIYEEGKLIATEQDGWEPLNMLRSYHLIGAESSNSIMNFMDGTLGYLKLWHGVELSDQNVKDMLCPVDCGPGLGCNIATQACVDCPIGAFSSSTNKLPCSFCPSGTTTSWTGATSALSCECNGGYYSLGGECNQCPAGKVSTFVNYLTTDS